MITSTVACFAILLTLVASDVVKERERVTIDVDGLGKVTGLVDETARTNRKILAFQGIKFAQAPVGDLRFKAPVPTGRWAGTYDATEPGILCPQKETLHNVTASVNVEDCLHLSVYAPQEIKNASVMFYIHGGSNTEGGASHHPPSYLLEKDIVLVVAQYRLGALGFLSLQTNEIPGNAGHLDQIEALKWVQKYIKSFGGDPKRVTVVGQSAGAMAIGLLMQSKLVTEDLFRGAIMQSGCSLGSTIIDEKPIENARDIAFHAKCDPHRNATLEELTSCLKKTPVLNLLLGLDLHKFSKKFEGHSGGSRAVVGGPSRFLDTSPIIALQTGNYRNIPVMAGVTKQDGSFIIASLYDIFEATLPSWKEPNFIKNHLISTINQMIDFAEDDSSGSYQAMIESLFFTTEQLRSGNFTKYVPGLIDLYGMVGFKGPLQREMALRSINTTSQLYLYTFDYKGQFTRFGYGADTSHYPFEGGVHHSDDNIYLYPWPGNVAYLNKDDVMMSQIMVELWSSFVIDGKPSSRGTVEWKSMSGALGSYLKINKVSTLGESFLDELTVTSHISKIEPEPSEDSGAMSKRSVTSHLTIASVAACMLINVFLRNLL